MENLFRGKNLFFLFFLLRYIGNLPRDLAQRACLFLHFLVELVRIVEVEIFYFFQIGQILTKNGQKYVTSKASKGSKYEFIELLSLYNDLIFPILCGFKLYLNTLDIKSSGCPGKIHSWPFSRLFRVPLILHFGCLNLYIDNFLQEKQSDLERGILGIFYFVDWSRVRASVRTYATLFLGNRSLLFLKLYT